MKKDAGLVNCVFLFLLYAFADAHFFDMNDVISK